MLRIDKIQTIEGVTVYGDDRNPAMFYLVPDTPRFRRDDENGAPVFKFLKYRFPVDREDGKKGGGFCFFDVEFTVPDNKIEPIKSELQSQVNRIYQRLGRQPPPVTIGTITYTKGTAGLLLKEDGGTLIERVSNPGKPSLFGKNITPFALELSPEGSTLFWEAMQGRGGVVQVVYDLSFIAALPPVSIWGQFRSEAFYSFYQSIDTDWNLWSEDSYQETIREQFRNSDSMVLRTDFANLTDEKMKQELRDWAFRTLEDAAERRMIEAIAPVPDDDRDKPDGIEDVTRDITVTKIATFTLSFREKQAVEWNIAPQGTLPNITNLTDNDGNAVKWEDHAKEIDLNDPFFKQLNVSVHVNADFEQLPLNSVETHIEYKEGRSHEIKEFRFTNPNDVGTFAAFIENDKRDYDYWYEVNYQGESQTFKSEKEKTNEQILTINVGDVGIVDVTLVPGDINFEQVRRAQVTMRYQDRGLDDAIEEQFTLDKDTQSKRFQHVIFQPQRRPYEYRIKYFMTDGKEYEIDWAQARTPQLAINDPFGATKTIHIRTAGNLESDIQTIFLDLRYVDEANDYSQTHSVALSKDNPFSDWEFPVIDERSGKVFYSGNITYRNGTIEEIPLRETIEPTILVGEIIADFLDVQVLANLLDFSQVQLCQVMLHYVDEANDVDERQDLIFSASAAVPQKWQVELKNKTLKNYRWSAMFFLADGSQRTIDWADGDAPTIILQLPAA